MARIGYGKIGRSWNLNPDKATSVGGDADVINLLMRLAKMHPEHEFVLVGKNSGEDPAQFGYPPNITNPWTEWRKNWTSVPEPQKADLMIEHFRSISGDFHKTLDHMIVWAGQHGSANSRIPMIGSNWIIPPGTTGLGNFSDETTNEHNDVITGGTGEDLATPQYAFVHYISWYLDFISRWRESGPGPLMREEIWLCPDPRNYLKCREKRWPLRFPVIAQYDFLRYHKGERYGRFPDALQELDPTGFKENTIWVSNTAYCYGGLELTAVASPEAIAFDPNPGPHAFGMVVNENLTNVKDSRLDLLKTWVLPNFPDAEIRGHWTAKSQMELGRVITPVPYTEAYGVMKSFATTITTPASGSEWATAKPWESFALGSICFFHPRYDGQGHIIPLKEGKMIGNALVSEDSLMLADFLRVSSAKELKEKVEAVTTNPELYDKIVRAQRRHYEVSYARWAGGAQAISDRIENDIARIEEDLKITEMNGLDAYPWLRYTQPPAAQVQGRAAARPRGTNEERKKKKPPISTRRALRPEDLIAPVVVDEPVVESEPLVEASKAPEMVAELDEDGGVTFAGDAVQIPGGYTVVASSAGSSKFVLDSKTHEPIPAVMNTQLPPEYVTKLFEMTPTSDERWPRRFLALAEEVASWSKDPSTKCGCVLVNDRRRVVGVGYNGLPDRIADDPEILNNRELKRNLVIHAEMNSLFNCEVPTLGLHAYATHPSCGECAKMLVGAGIASFTAYEGESEFKDRWNCDEAIDVFKRANVPYRLLKK